MGRGSLIPYLLVLLVAMSYSWIFVYSSWMYFEMDALAIKSLISGTCALLDGDN